MDTERRYLQAYDLHYNQARYDEALKIYNEIIEDYPTSNEAAYAKTQIQNIEQLPLEKRHQPVIIADNLSSIILTTANSLEGYQVTETLEIVSSECVFGINLFKDFFAGVVDVFGGRSESTQKVLRDARKVCLHELRKEAKELSADAVIAVRLAYSEFSGKGKSMLFLVASGTAVKVRKMDLA